MLLQVIWVEHVEVEQTLPINMLYHNLVQNGGAFGAHRWVGALQHACDRFSSFATLGGLQNPDPYGGSSIRT
jgi:homeobox-leucine zipper protein